jgi:hypothetical protein
MNGREVEEFLTHLAVEDNVAAYTQNQAFSLKTKKLETIGFKLDAVY